MIGTILSSALCTTLYTVQCPSPKLIPLYAIIASLLRVTLPWSFFLCVPVCLGMLHKKFCCSQTKTVCLVGFVRDRIWAALYQIGSNNGCKNIFLLPILHGGQESGLLALEGWMVPSKEHKRAYPLVKVQPDTYFDTCKEPGRGHRLPQVRGGVHDQEAGGGHPEQWKHQKKLASRPGNPTNLFRMQKANFLTVLFHFSTEGSISVTGTVSYTAHYCWCIMNKSQIKTSYTLP